MSKNKQYTEISFTLEPDNLETLANEIHNSLNFEQNEMQKESFVKSIDLSQQHKILYNKESARSKDMLDRGDERIDNLYFKANVAKQDKFEEALDKEIGIFEDDEAAADKGPAYRLANGYKKLHDADIERFSRSLFININGEEKPIDLGKIKTMDELIDHIQKTFNVSISDRQRKYMRVFFNQGGPQGMSGAALSSCLVDDQGVPIASADPKQKNVLLFKDGKFDSIETQTIFNGERGFEGKSATAITKINLSELKGEKSSSPQKYLNADWIPDKNCKAGVEVSIKGDLPISLDKKIDKSLKNHTNFKGKEFTKTKFSFLSKIVSFFKNPFALFSSIKKSQDKEQIQSGPSFFSRLFSKMPYNKVKNDGIEVVKKKGSSYYSSAPLIPLATPNLKHNQNDKQH